MALEQHLTNEQLLQQQQVQRLTANQVLQVRLLEMPLAQIEQNIKAELSDNPALDADVNPDANADVNADVNVNPDANLDVDANADVNANLDANGNENIEETDDFEQTREREDRDDALDSALENMGSDDRMESDYRQRASNSDPDADQEEMIYGDTQSFYDKIMEQVSDESLDEKQQLIMEYIIGSLDGDGFLRKDVSTICDELCLFNGIDCTEDDINEAVSILHTFEPAGLGARNLQECLLLQIARRKPTALRKYMALVIKDHFEEFTKKHWERIRQHLHLTEEQIELVIGEIRRLNPRPGASLGEAMGRSVQQITPDFIVDTTDDGTVTFQLNQGEMPRLYVSPDFAEQLRGFQGNAQSLNRMQKEALLYTKEKVERAKGYIEAIEKRRQTMTVTMRAIIDIQRKFFLEGDESDLVPMTLKDVGDRVGLDISTVSRVCNTKYVDTQWGIFPLRHFFGAGYSINDTGEELSTRKMKLALVEIIKGEDKKKPYSDDALAKLMKEQGYPIARRTVAKYREQQGIPVARMRR